MHIHTTASDGMESGIEVVLHAKDIGVTDLIAITDHDSIQSVKEAGKAAEYYQIPFITGVELSAFHKFKGMSIPSQIHVLGYGFDLENKELNDYLTAYRQNRVIRSDAMVENVNVMLKKDGIKEIAYGELQAMQDRVQDQNGNMSSIHIAQLILERGKHSSRRVIFQKYLKKCTPDTIQTDLKYASELIRNAGGVVVPAHPHLKGFLTPGVPTAAQVESMLTEIKDYIEGLECYHYTTHGKHDLQNFYTGLANKMNLIVTGGSDHHGGRARDRLGKVYVPQYVAENMKIIINSN